MGDYIPKQSTVIGPDTGEAPASTGYVPKQSTYIGPVPEDNTSEPTATAPVKSKSSFIGDAANAAAKGLGSTIGNTIAYTVDPNAGGLGSLVASAPEYANAARKDPVQAAIGVVKGAGQGLTNLANAVTTPGRLVSAGIPAFAGAATSGASFDQSMQAGKEAMAESEIPTFRPLLPTNPTQEIASRYGRGGVEVASMVPAGGKIGAVGTDLSKLATKPLGAKIVKMGEEGLESKMAIPDNIAGRDASIQLGRDQILDDIKTLKTAPYKSRDGKIVKGEPLLSDDPYVIAERAQEKINENSSYVDAVLKRADDKFEAENPHVAGVPSPKPFDMDASFASLGEKLGKGSEPGMMMVEPKTAQKLLTKIHNVLDKEGLTGQIDYSQVPEAKRIINREIDLFKKGTNNIKNAPIAEKIGDKLYVQLKQDLEKDVPDIRDVNNETHRLINVIDAAEYAGNRISKSKNPPVSFREMLASGGAGTAGLLLSGITLHGGANAAMAAGAALVASKIYKHAVTPTNMINTGRAMRKGVPLSATGGAATLGAAGAVYGGNDRNSTSLDKLK